MAQLKQGDLRTPFGGEGAKKLRGRIDRLQSAQGAAANLTDTQVSDVAGLVMQAYVVTSATPAAGESLAVDITKNGVSILTSAPYTVDSTKPGKFIYTIPVPKGTTVAIGDVIAFTRAYTAGGGATPLGASRVVLEVA